MNDWEIGEVANLLEVLNSHPALLERTDLDGNYTVRGSSQWNQAIGSSTHYRK